MILQQYHNIHKHRLFSNFGEELQYPVCVEEDTQTQTNTLLFCKDAWNNRIQWFVEKSFRKN
jgi:hypothetical protein